VRVARPRRRAGFSAGSEPVPPDGIDPLPGVPPAARGKLARLGIHSLADALLHLPLRYEDETCIHAIADAPQDRPVLVEGEILDTEVAFRPRRQLVSRVKDASGLLYLRFLNFYPSQAKQLAAGRWVRCFGEVRPGFFGAEMIHPRCRIVERGAALPAGLTPVYPTTAGVSQDTLRRLAGASLAQCDLSDSLPAALRKSLKLASFEHSVRLLHDPPAGTSQALLERRGHPAWRRIKFDELLAQQLSLRLFRAQRGRLSAPPLPPRGELARELIGSLPFALTMAQRRAIDDLARDLARPTPMQRLLQGDVGSGKTVVAAIAALQAIENGFQVAVMAPTEILAEQHHRKFHQWLAPLGVRVAWLAGSLRSKEKRSAVASIGSGDCAIAIGTQAVSG
jgi:ATP-dependent DNA helicase RecG